MPVAFELFLVLGDRVGVFVFALSGGIAAVRKDMDLFGVVALAFLPAVGGGTLRDLILDVPVFWLADSVALGLAAAGGVAALFVHGWIETWKPLRWADALGLALFAATGAAKATALGHAAPVVWIMGVMTACAGGLLRDVVANRDPLLLKEDIYATAALLGAGTYTLVHELGAGSRAAFAFAAGAAFALRGLAIVFRLSLPRAGAPRS